MDLKNYARRWRATWNPDMYHGWGRSSRYFEGWYFKLVDPTEEHLFAVIPGISFGQQGECHAFVQVFDGKACKASYHEFPEAAFLPDGRRFGLEVGGNYFSASRIRLDLPELSGELRMLDIHPWPRSLGAPGIMGWYGFVPFMECYHGVVSLHHTLHGRLRVGAGEVNFDNGIGYMEKDWGTSFPHSWIWMQSNHFDAPGPVCLMASVARIPWLGSHFIGYIVGWLWEGRVYRFATYTGAQMRASLGEHEVRLAFRDRRYRLEITAFPAEGAPLVSPISGQMTGKVNESLLARVQVAFYEGEHLVFEGEGRNAGLELAGPVEELLTDQWRR